MSHVNLFLDKIASDTVGYNKDIVSNIYNRVQLLVKEYNYYLFVGYSILQIIRPFESHYFSENIGCQSAENISSPT